MTWFRIRRKEKHHGVKQYKATPQELLTQSLIQEEPGQTPPQDTAPAVATPEPVSATPTPAPIPAPAPAEMPAPQIPPAETIDLEPALKLREQELQALIALKDEKVEELANNTELTEQQKYGALIKTLTTIS